MDNNFRQVHIVGVSIPFADLVALTVKLAFAAIPATIIIALIWGAIAAFVAGITGAI